MQRSKPKQNPSSKLAKDNKLIFDLRPGFSLGGFAKKAIVVFGLLVVTAGYVTYNLLPERHVDKTFAAAGYVQSITGSAKTATSVNATYAATPTAGNLLIAVVGSRDPNITINPIAGWSTAINQSDATYPGQAIFYKFSTGTEGTVTATTTTTSGSLGIQLYEYSGVNGVLDQVNSGAGNSGTPTAGSVTISEADQLLFAAFVDDINTNHNDGSWSDVEGFTERNDFKTTGSGTNCTYAGGDRLISAVGTYTVSTTIGSTANWRGQFVAFTTSSPTFAQSAYRWFQNLNSTNVGTPLAAQNTAATLTSTGQAFRLRALMHIGVKAVPTNSARYFKLQYAAKSGTCDTAFTGETYADVTAASTIAYYNNATPVDNAALTANTNDPTHGADTIVNQSYQELNNFNNNIAAIPIGQDGKWDFSLFDNGATGGTSYCFRIVRSDGTLLNTYSVVPEIMTYTPNTPPTGAWNSATQKTNGTGLVDLSIEVNDANANNTKAKIEYETDSDGACNGPWAAATLAGPAVADFNDTGGAPDVNNGNAYQVGSTATTRIITSSGSNTVDFDWNSQANLPNANGNQCLRLTVNDDIADQTTPATRVVAVDNVKPTLSSWSLNMATGTLTMVFNESVLASALDVTAITLQNAATSSTSYTLTNSTTASGNGTTIVINLSATDLAAIEANNGLATSINNSYLTITALAEDDLLGNPNNAIANGAGIQAAAYTANIKYRQSAYRFFNNLNSTDVGTALAAQDTAATLGSNGAAFRLRGLTHVYVSNLATSGQAFKLQFAVKSGACDTAFTGETYADVTAATAIAYNNNPTPADGANLTANANDPTHGGDTTVNQTYEELNNFTNSVAAIPSGQDGMWDFALIDNDGTSAASYCLRWVESDGTLLNNYDVVPEINTVAAANNPPTGAWNSATQKTNGTGYADLSIEVDDPEDGDTKAKIEYETDSDGACNGPWAAATLIGPATADFDDSGGAPDVNNGNAYQVGSTATTRIITSSGSNTVQFDWDSKTDLPTADGNNCLRLTVNDDTQDQTTPATQVIDLDNVDPALASWSLDLSAQTLTLVFDESVNASALDVTAITLQDAATSSTTYTLTDSTTASGNGTTIVINLSSTDYNAIQANTALATSINDSYLTITSSAEDDLRGNANAAIADGAGIQAAAYTAKSTFEQSAYRFFNNLDSTNVGTVLAAQDAAATLATDDVAFRLRGLIHVGGSALPSSGQSFKLQFAVKSGTCDTAFVGETYADVTAATAIAYNNNPTPADGANLTANANDPVHAGHTTSNQTYEELNNFTNSVSNIASGRDGHWDFALDDNNGTTAASYCFRFVKSDGSLLDTYSVIPEITTATGNNPPTGTWNSATQKTDGSGLADLSIEVDDPDDDDTRAKIEYETDSDGACDGPWANATLVGPAVADFNDTGGAPDINNANPYQVGSTATTRIITSSGSNTVQFDWDSQTDLPTANGTQCLRLTVNDDTVDQTTPATQTISIDNVDPTVTDGNITVSGATGTSGAFIIGDTVVVTWDNSAGGDNNT
ncbi:hypothetical protein KKG19_02195, partial [Patescibacteria group bacterium]|nr:hypothetical protein [Patescibacteria group bacterium]